MLYKSEFCKDRVDALSGAPLSLKCPLNPNTVERLSLLKEAQELLREGRAVRIKSAHRIRQFSTSKISVGYRHLAVELVATARSGDAPFSQLDVAGMA
jgi:hypothetical protein